MHRYSSWAPKCLRNLGMNTFLNLMLRCSKSPAYKTLSPSSQNLEKKNSKAIKGLYFKCILLHFTVVLQDKFLSGDMKIRPDLSVISCDPNVL